MGPDLSCQQPETAAFLAAAQRTAPFPFDAFRALRFAHGIHCPRCSSSRVQRWGSFSGRRRYRCRACRRTFSDFTGTPLAYLKRIGDWPAFCQCVVNRQTIRESARHLAADPSTTFRWRHRLLPALRATDRTMLLDEVRVGETRFAYSEKGRRDLDRKPRRRAARNWLAVRSAWVIIAQDAENRTFTGVSGTRYPRAAELTATLAPRLDRSTTCLLGASGPRGAIACAATELGLDYRRATGANPGMTTLRRYTSRLRNWLRKFHGVATRYLEHYLVWHRSAEVRTGQGFFALLVLASAAPPVG